MPKKLLLLTASYGTGHMTASKFIKKSLDAIALPAEIESKIVDFLKPPGSSHEQHVFEKLYNVTMEKPALWDFIFDFSNGKAAHFYFQNIFPRFFSEFFKMFDAEKPDYCVNTHPYWNYLIDHYNKIRAPEKKLRYSCVVTDSTEIHKTWVTDDAQYLMVCDDESREALVKAGVPEGKIRVTGFPVNTELGKPMDTAAFLKEQGLTPGVLTILFVVGLGDVSKFLRLIDYLSRQEGKKFQVIIITGKYKAIYEVLTKKTYKPPTKVIGWCDRMPDFIRSSDLIISKCGGAIVMETLAAGKPVLIPVFTPGQERGNAKLLLKHGFGFVERDYEKTTQILDKIIASPETIYKMQSDIKKFSKPGASDEIAKFVKSIVQPNL